MLLRRLPDTPHCARLSKQLLARLQKLTILREGRMALALASSRKFDAGAEVAESSSLEARRRAGLDDPAVIRTLFVDRAREAIRHGYVEAPAAITGVLDESKPRRLAVELRVQLESSRLHTRLVRLEEMDGARPVVATPPAGHAVAAVGVRRPVYW
jgi:hypothetical protein